jgi:hypothetical protein
MCATAKFRWSSPSKIAQKAADFLIFSLFSGTLKFHKIKYHEFINYLARVKLICGRTSLQLIIIAHSDTKL